jgi:hypothetical protein
MGRRRERRDHGGDRCRQFRYLLSPSGERDLAGRGRAELGGHGTGGGTWLDVRGRAELGGHGTGEGTWLDGGAG